MSFPWNITNPGFNLEGLLTSTESSFVTDLVGLSYVEGDILYHNGTNIVRLGIGTDGQVLTVNNLAAAPQWETPVTGYTNLTSFVDQTAWRVFYSNGLGDVTELALGASGTFLKSNGATSAPTFAVPAGTGDVSKVGIPVDNQIGVWTGDGTIEGDTALTFDTTTNTLATTLITATTVTANLTGNVTGNVSGNASTVTTNANLTGMVTSVGNVVSLVS